MSPRTDLLKKWEVVINNGPIITTHTDALFLAVLLQYASNDQYENGMCAFFTRKFFKDIFPFSSDVEKIALRMANSSKDFHSNYYGIGEFIPEQLFGGRKSFKIRKREFGQDTKEYVETEFSEVIAYLKKAVETNKLMHGALIRFGRPDDDGTVNVTVPVLVSYEDEPKLEPKIPEPTQDVINNDEIELILKAISALRTYAIVHPNRYPANFEEHCLATISSFPMGKLEKKLQDMLERNN